MNLVNNSQKNTVSCFLLVRCLKLRCGQEFINVEKKYGDLDFALALRWL